MANNDEGNSEQHSMSVTISDEESSDQPTPSQENHQEGLYIWSHGVPLPVCSKNCL